MSMSTMSTIFEIPEQSSSEYSDELMTALAAGGGGQSWKFQTPYLSMSMGTSSQASVGNRGGRRNFIPTSLVFSDESEKAQSQHSGFSDATLKTTEQWRQKTTHRAPFSARSTQGAPLVFSDASEKAQHSDQRRKWRQIKPQGAPVPAGSKQRGKLRIPEHLTKHLQEASFEMHMPAKPSQRSPMAAPKVLACSPHGSPMPDKITNRPKLNIPEPLRAELLQQRPPVPIEPQRSGKLRVPEHLTEDLQKASFETPMPNKPLRAPVTAPKVFACSSHEAPMPDKIADRPKLKIPEPLRSELLQKKPQAPSLKIEPVCSGWKYLKNPEQLSKELLRQRLQNAPVLVPAATLRIPRQQREKWEQQLRQLNIPQEVSVPAKTPLVPPCSPQHPPGSQKRECPWSTEASDNVGLRQAPPQKLCVEMDKHLKLRSYNHQAPQETTSQLKQRTQSSLQPRTHAEPEKSIGQCRCGSVAPQKKQRMDQDQQSDPDSIEQIDYLCKIFTKCCVI